jgi:iron complex transport system substrate-binding protein
MLFIQIVLLLNLFVTLLSKWVTIIIPMRLFINKGLWYFYNMHMRLIAALVLLFAGCTGQAELPGDEGPIQIVDDLGRNITLEKHPERIVSTAPSNTEILFALGLGDRVIGVTEYCDYPPEATEKEKIGGFSTVNIEKITSLNPDIIFAA